MEEHFKGFFKACAADASAKKRPCKREQHEKAEARASAKRSRKAAGEESAARASSTCSSVSGDAARAVAGQLLQEQKNAMRRQAGVAGRDLVGKVRYEPPAPPREVCSERQMRKWMRENSLTEADALRFRPHTFQEEAMALPSVYAPQNSNSNASS